MICFDLKNYYLNISLDIDKTIYVPGSDVSFVCKIRGKDNFQK